MSHTSEAVLEVSDLTKIYGWEYSVLGKRVGRRVMGVKNLSFSIMRGEIFGFLGPNGAGKTTTMRVVLDYLHSESGKITVFGLDSHKDYLEIRRRMSFLPGDLSLFEDYTGNELISFFDKFRASDQKFLQELKTMFRVDLTLRVKSLSKGNRQQLGLILAFASKPDLLILDEPTAGLDPLMSASVHSLLKRLKAEGKTVFLSSHDLSEVQSVCDRIGIIKNGEMILIEEVDKLVSKSIQNVTVRFKEKVPEEKEVTSIPNVLTVKVNGDVFNFQVKEDINPLLKFLSTHNIRGLSIQNASLEEIFLQFYR